MFLLGANETVVKVFPVRETGDGKGEGILGRFASLLSGNLMGDESLSFNSGKSRLSTSEDADE